VANTSVSDKGQTKTGKSAKGSSPKTGNPEEVGSAGTRFEGPASGLPSSQMSGKDFERELATLQLELVTMLDWVRHSGHKLVVLFEGRDAAGKGSAIKRISDALNPRFCRVTALPAPTERERTQWYFQRYVANLPAAGEMVLFDRSWYNRAGVERVMGFCTDGEYWDFLRSVPEFERMLVRSGIQLVKYWFSVSDEEQERRFLGRLGDPAKQWKLSPMDLYSRSRWVEYSKAKDLMMEHTSTVESPWWEVDGDNKRRARLNCISHLLSLVPYERVARDKIELPPRQEDAGYRRPPKEALNWIPARY
jgi:polyphosphate kinase 2